MREQFGLTRNSLDAYARALDCYFSFMEFRKTACEESTRADVACWINELRSRGLANATLIQRVTALRLFFEFLVEEGLRPSNPVLRGGAIRCYGPAVFRTAGPVRRIHKLPWIPTLTTSTLICRYLNRRHTMRSAPDAMFLSESPPKRSEPITAYTWTKVVERIAKRSSLPRLTTHTMRHLRLTDLARAGLDIHEIATFAGNRVLQSTLIYIHLSARDLTASLARTMAGMTAPRHHQCRLRMTKMTALRIAKQAPPRFKLDLYDRSPVLTSEGRERIAAVAIEQQTLHFRLNDPLTRLLVPLRDCLFLTGAKRSQYSLLRELVTEMQVRQKAFWAWREEEWSSLFRRRKNTGTTSNTLQHVMAMAAILCEVDLHKLRNEARSIIRRYALTTQIFGREPVDTSIELVHAELKRLGYTGYFHLGVATRSVSCFYQIGTQMLEA